MDKKILALVGVVVLIIGVFLPIVSQGGTSISLLLPGEGNGLGDGIWVVVLALVAGGLALVGQVRHVIWPALLALALIGYDFFKIKSGMDELVERAGGSEFGGGWTDGLQLNYLGWAVMCIGALVLLVAGIMAWTGTRPAAAPPPAV